MLVVTPEISIPDEEFDLIEPKIRKKTRPTKASKERRIESKKRRGTTKQGRGARSWE